MGEIVTDPQVRNGYYVSSDFRYVYRIRDNELKIFDEKGIELKQPYTPLWVTKIEEGKNCGFVINLGSNENQNTRLPREEITPVIKTDLLLRLGDLEKITQDH